jgi:hypothetical protein
MEAPAAPARTTAWHFVGSASTFPNVTAEDGKKLAEKFSCGDSMQAGCRVFNIPKTGSEVCEADLEDDFVANELRDQVLVFQYKGKFHAVDHVRQILLPVLPMGTMH